MVDFSTLDWVVVVSFVLIILTLGFSAKLKESSFLQFLTAGRSLTLPALVATLVCTWYGGILGIGESVSYYGIGTWLLLGVPYYAFALIYAFFLSKKVRQADQISIPERLKALFGKKVGLVVAFLVFLLGIPAAHILMLSVLVQSLTGLGMTMSMLLVAIIGGAFITKGGLLADVRVSLLAFVAMYVGFAVLVFHGWQTQGAPWESWFATLDASYLKYDGNLGIIGVVSFFILGAWTLADPGFHQRVASAESPKTSQKGVLASVLFWILFDFLSMSAGMYALSSGLEVAEGGLYIFPAYGSLVLPPGLLGLFYCGMLGTILSAFVGYSMVSGSSVGRDVVCQIKEGLNETQWARIGIVVTIILAVILARQIESVVVLWYSWAGAIVGVLVIPLLISYLGKSKKPTKQTMLTALCLGTGVGLGTFIFGIATNNPYIDVQFNKDLSISLGTLLPGLVITGLILAIGKKEDRQHDG